MRIPALHCSTKCLITAYRVRMSGGEEQLEQIHRHAKQLVPGREWIKIRHRIANHEEGLSRY